MWRHSLKVAQLLRSAACLHTNQSRSYLNHLVHRWTVDVVGQHDSSLLEWPLVVLELIKGTTYRKMWCNNDECLFQSLAQLLIFGIVMCSHISLEKCLTRNCPARYNQDYALATIMMSDIVKHNLSSRTEHFCSKCHAQ